MKSIKDLYSVSHPLALAPVSATTTGSVIDFANIEQNLIEFQFGVRTDGQTVPSLVDSPDGVTFTAVPATSIIGTLSPAVSNVCQKISYDGPNRYVKPVLTSTGATTGVVAGVNVVAKPRRQPAP